VGASLTAYNGSSFETTWAYDGASRLSVVTSGVDSTTYTYAANSGLVTGTSTARGGVSRLAVTSQYNALERLTAISSATGATVISSHAYNYNLLNHRTESLLENGSKWDHQYDNMGQVTAGEKSNESAWPVPGMKFGYSFDGIGNRSSSTINGRTGSYAANVANQYTERQVPGAIDVRGKVNLLTKVTVNTELTDRLHEYFYKELEVDNSGAPQYVGVSVVAVKNDAGPNGEDIQSDKSGNLFLAKTPETFTYDLEGNLTSDGRWNYTWDGENRLTGQETIVTVPTAAKRKLEYAYDAESRRIQKKVFGWDGNVWALEKDHRYLYDGWNMVAELDATNTMMRKFVWGLDLSRTPQGAGGVGGLFAIQGGAESHLPCFDGNGNVMALVKASDQSISGRYEYGPFGESLVVEEAGVSNPFRFSTKFHDKETGLYYYGYRYYNPTTGRWPSRDPIEEKGGIGLYKFEANDGLGKWDRLGLDPMDSGLTFPPDQLIGPNLLDHLNTDKNNKSAIADFEAWLQKNYAKSLEDGRKSIKSDIDAAVKKLCFERGYTVSKQSFAVGPKTQKKNGEYPGDISYMLSIGRFSMYSRNVNITWNADACTYEWAGEVYVEEVTGATKGQDIFNDFAHATGLFYEKTVEYATWSISGSGECPN
jgi:RHS repeat-associated protein